LDSSGPSPFAVAGRFAFHGAKLTTVDNIEALIAALGSRFDDDETEVIERVLRDHGGTIPDKQLISEAALALAIHRRSKITG
jgi:hypothetical protein